MLQVLQHHFVFAIPRTVISQIFTIFPSVLQQAITQGKYSHNFECNLNDYSPNFGIQSVFIQFILMVGKKLSIV